jgi:hypothetical protein
MADGGGLMSGCLERSEMSTVLVKGGLMQIRVRMESVALLGILALCSGHLQRFSRPRPRA